MMNNYRLHIILLSCILICTSCNELNGSGNKFGESATAEQSEYTKTFSEIGFSITTPCELEDVSAHSSGDFIVNYGGVENPNDKQKMAAYQVIVTRLPVGYKNISKAQLDAFIDDALKKATNNFTDVEKIHFGYEEYPGYVGYTSHNGLRQKGIMFAKDNYIIGLTVLTNDDIEAKFNKFTNGFKTLEQKSNPTTERASVVETTSTLPKKFQHSRFRLNYPKTWDIVQKDVRATAHTTIAVQVMDKSVGDYDFASNVNVIVSTDKHTEATSSLARISFNQVKEAGLECRLIGIKDCNLNGCKGSVAEYTANVQGFTLHVWQYIVKKSDNTTLTLTATIDHSELSAQKKIITEIVNSFVVE